eukprot:16445651-Heterocapsa_arctica.AAC.1
MPELVVLTTEARSPVPAIPASWGWAAMSGRKGSWDGDTQELAGIIGVHVGSPSAIVYGDNPKMAKVEPPRIAKFKTMWKDT